MYLLFFLLNSSTLEHTLEKKKQAVNTIVCTIEREARNISIKKWEIYYFKIKIIPFIMHFSWNYAIRYVQVHVQKRGFSIKGICHI